MRALADSRVLILKADQLCAATLQAAAERALPGARVERVAHLAAAGMVLAAGGIELLLTGVAAMDGDTLDFLTRLTRPPRPARHILVVTGKHDHYVLANLRALAIDGVFDSWHDTPAQLERAITLVTAGQTYWSPSALERLRRQATDRCAICRLLTPTEQLVFSVIGDGSDDQEAAARLGLRPSTIQSVRRVLHRKLGAQHKGELVRLAVQHGFVRITPEGVVRPGFSRLLATWGASDEPGADARESAAGVQPALVKCHKSP